MTPEDFSKAMMVKFSNLRNLLRPDPNTVGLKNGFIQYGKYET
jgi:hypothetical protein